MQPYDWNFIVQLKLGTEYKNTNFIEIWILQ